MPYIKNLWRAPIIIDDVNGDTLVLEPNGTAEVPQEVLSKPMVRHYLEVHRLDLMRHPIREVLIKTE